MSEKQMDPLDNRLSLVIPITVVILFSILVGGLTSCTRNNNEYYAVRLEQREQTIREVCAANVDLKTDAARAQVCNELVRSYR